MKSIRKSHLFHDYYNRLKCMALSVYEWENLPPTCNGRFLERCLFENGCAIFVEDENMSYLNLRGVPTNTLNVYEEATAYTAFSTGYSKIYNVDDCVFIRNNILTKSTDSTILYYAERLTALELAIMVNINAQKTPVLIRTDEKTKKSLETIYNQYEGNKPVIFGTKLLQEKPLDVLNTNAPFVADKLQEQKRIVWNEAIEFLGLNTNPADKKKERLIVDEVNTNNEQIELQSETMLLTRQEACEQINEKYGLNVKVKKRITKEGQEWQNTQLSYAQ